MAAQEQQNCLIHSPGVEDSTLSSCSLTALSRIVEFRDQWVKYDCLQKFITEKSYDYFAKKDEKDLDHQEIQKTLMYHRQCYQRFTDKNKLERIRNKKVLEEAVSFLFVLLNRFNFKTVMCVF